MLYLVLYGMQLLYSLAVCFHVVTSCVNTWLMSFLISCVFVSCFAHGWWFVCWPCACVFFLCEHMAFVLSTSFLCVMSYHVNCLDPPIVLPDYWLICPTCVSLVTLLICSLYNLLVFAVLCQFIIYVTVECVLSCPVLSCPVLSCPVLSCPVLSCPVLSCPVLSCPVLSLSCQLSCFSPSG